MDEVPNAVLTEALSYLSINEAMRLSSISHRFLQMARDVWRRRPVLVRVDSAALVEIKVVDPFLVKRCSLPAMNKSMLSARAMAVFNGHLIVVCIGPDRQHIIYQFQRRSCSWRRMTMVPTEVSHVIACFPFDDDQLFIVGSEALYLYSRKTNFWRPYSRMPRPHVNGAAARIDGKIIVCGGCSGYDDSEGEPSLPQDHVDIFDVASLQWSECEPMPISLESMAFAQWNHDFVMSGGYSDLDLDSLSSNTYIYSTKKKIWTSIRPFKTPSKETCLFSLEEQLFAFQGGGRFYKYDGNSDSWMNADQTFCSDTVVRKFSPGTSLMMVVDVSVVGDLRFSSGHSPRPGALSFWRRRSRRK